MLSPLDDDDDDDSYAYFVHHSRARVVQSDCNRFELGSTNEGVNQISLIDTKLLICGSRKGLHSNLDTSTRR